METRSEETGGVGMLGSEIARRWRIWLGIVISAAFLYWAANQASSISAIGATLRQASYWYVIPALGAYFLGVWLRAVRWHYLLRPMRSIRPTRLFPVVVIGYMANDVLPARLGEAVRAYVLGQRESVSKSAALATILVERLFDGVVMLSFMALVGLAFTFDDTLQQIFRFAGAAFATALVTLIVIASSKPTALRLLDVALHIVPPRPRARIADFAIRFLEGLDVLQSPRLMAMTLLLTIGAWCAETAMYYVISLGFQLTVGVPAYVLATAVANLGTMVPSSPGYIGTFEALATRSLTLFGADPDAALSYVIALHLALLVPVTVLGFVYLWRYGLSLRQVQSDLRRGLPLSPRAVPEPGPTGGEREGTEGGKR
ncbi:MAG: flippase-like domain-containing protein [Chloroflexi bacterium]|nr:flippase-like domain-containing protein [Chloroflexota bacterium]